MLPVTSLTAAAARAEILRTQRRLAARAARLKAKGVFTAESRRALELKANPLPKDATRNQIVARAAELRRLDASPATRAATAPKVVARRVAKAERDALVARASKHTTAARMTREELAKAVSIQKKRLRDRARRTAKTMGGDTHATRKLRELLTGSPDVSKMSRNQLRAMFPRLDKVSKYEGMSVSGARKQVERGVNWFGPNFRTMTPEQQGAIWDEVHRYQAESPHVIKSDEAIDRVAALFAMSQDGTGRVSMNFYRQSGVLKVSFGHSQSDAMENAINRMADDRFKARLLSSESSKVSIF